jgi:hypothetical protein
VPELDDDEWDDESWDAWLEAENDAADMPEQPSAILETAQGDEDDDEVDAAPEPDDEPAPPPVASPSPRYPEPPCSLVIAQGDCLLSIAHRYRMSEQTIWNHGPNAALRARRNHPNQLAPGDELHIPAREDAIHSVQTERRHRFRVTRSDCEIVIRLVERAEPRRGVRYTLLVEGEERAGATDGDGCIRERVSRSARSGTLVLHLAAGDRCFPVRIGHLDPIETVTGVQERLNHLGFMAGAIDGWIGPETQRAIRVFQHARGLRLTGELDAATRDELRKAHGT